ncbi:MAG TPA: YkvA family protein [Rhizomicrobium sp.]|nr:YkvA family protein [Rhizomicrobium sp.]
MPGFPDPSAVQLPAVIARNERTVEKNFWKKLLRVAGRVPFAEELAAAYFCATDPATPSRVKAILLAALAYFVIPTDAIPDFVAGLGFTDDAAVLAMAIGLVSGYVKPRHHERARRALGLPEKTD